jgi:uncharacterized protein DUF1837/Cap4-like dsDNA endonuclease family protein
MSVVTTQAGAPRKPVTNAGGVAARQGFKYQDHVAAFFVLTCIADERLIRVECETEDDIVLMWKSAGLPFLEYVQVKTTEDDKKWSQTEILKRENPKSKQPNSLIEKSLLCDTGVPGALFRIVSRRDVGKVLSCLTLGRDNPLRVTPAHELGQKLLKKYSTKSAGGLSLADWAKRAVWHHAGTVESLEATNIQNLLRLADLSGANPTLAHARAIYDDLLGLVDKAALASKITHAPDKVLSRLQILAWWHKHLDETEAAKKQTSKPYRIPTGDFFAELHTITEDGIRRALTSHDVRFENRQWRSLQLADHLVDWLPEIALKASDLASVQHLQMRQKTRASLRAIKRHSSISNSTLLAEALLHAILRQHLQSEPIACKIFYESSTGIKSFGHAHIVHSTVGDELWLGRAAVSTAAAYDDVLKNITSSLEKVLDADFLKDEREVILALREPRHLMPTSLENALSQHAPIDDLVDVICIPIFIGYDSEVLSTGYSTDYKNLLIEEVKRHYAHLKPQLPAAIVNVKVHIFLLPIECVRTLLSQFSKLIESSS